MPDLNQQQAVEQLLGQFKTQILMMLNETADEFDKLITDPKERQIYNKFTEEFGKKVLSIQPVVK